MEKEMIKRKEILVNPAIQCRMLLLVMVPVVIFIATLLVFHFLTFNLILDLNISAQVTRDVFELRNKFTIAFFIIIFVIPNILVPITFIFSHRIVGPIYHLKCRLEDFNNGKKVIPIKFRPGDYFNKVCDEFNIFLEKNKK